MQTKEELLEIEQRLLVEMGRRYGAHLEKAAAARRARSRERARRAREAAIQGIRTAGGDGGGGQAPRALLWPAQRSMSETRSCRKGGKHKRKEVPRVFRYKKSIPVSYEWQGYIYFTSLLYWELPKRTQEKILNLCIAAGKENYQALFEFVTTDAGAQAVCLRHHLSPSTLERAVRRYYEAFPRKI